MLGDIDLFVLDVDGVLRDTFRLVGQGFKRVFAASNIELKYGDGDIYNLLGLGRYNDRRNCARALLSMHRAGVELRDIVHTPDAEKRIDELVEKNRQEGDDALIDGIQQKYFRFFNSDENLDLVRFYPNTEKSVEALKGKGLKVAIFSNSGIMSIRRDIPFIGLFDSVVSIEDVKMKKPSGEGIVLTASRLNVPLQRTAYVGDTVVDMRAAKDAGCVSIALTDGMGLKMHLEQENPMLFFHTLSELVDSVMEEKH
ncbi:MAG: HAD hydrolase-like protein [Candidatus Micrarchaeota archaeon]|nr:HAD hydrolase-like protein [Candidatus Micrarchaeota archaeon]